MHGISWAGSCSCLFFPSLGKGEPNPGQSRSWGWQGEVRMAPGILGKGTLECRVRNEGIQGSLVWRMRQWGKESRYSQGEGGTPFQKRKSIFYCQEDSLQVTALINGKQLPVPWEEQLCCRHSWTWRLPLPPLSKGFSYKICLQCGVLVWLFPCEVQPVSSSGLTWS